MALYLAPPELIAHRRPGDRAGALFLVTEDQPSLFQIVRRDFDRHPVAGQRLDAVLFHLARRIGDELMPVIELNPIAGVRQDFGHQTFECEKFFLGQVTSPLMLLNLCISRGARAPMRIVASRVVIAMHEGNRTYTRVAR
jgi:hypothetical protein